MGPRNVQSAIHFLKENPAYQEEKPYAFRFELDTAEVPQSNMQMRKIEPITITDIRGSEDRYSLETNGFTVLRLDSRLVYDDFHDSKKVEVYLNELETLLKSHLGAFQVKVFRHGVS